MRPETRRFAVGLAALLLTAAAAAQQPARHWSRATPFPQLESGGTPSEWMSQPFDRSTPERFSAEDVVGWKRMQSLRLARFEYEDLSRNRIDHQPADEARFHRVEDAVFDCYEKYVRERLEESLAIDIRLDRMLGRRRPATQASTTRRGIRLSPQIGIGGSDYAGVKLRFPSTPGTVFSRTSIALRRHLDTEETEVDLTIEALGRYVGLEHVSGGEGDRFILSLRWEF